MKILVLGAAAGGGFPQWNGNDTAARRARAGDPQARPQTQSSIAVSADGRRWVLFNASPDLRQQINDNPALWPKADDPLRASPLAAVVLTNADVDHVAGLLSLRESQPMAVYGHARVLDVLARNSIFHVLNPAFVTRRALALETRQSVRDRDGHDLGIAVRPFAVPGKVALWLEDAHAPGLGTVEGDTVGLEISGNGRSFFYIPGCAAMTPQLARRLTGADLVFFDGTLWRDDEMIVAGVGAKTGQRMGHMSCDTVIAAFRDLGVGRKLFIHLNNTNPLLIGDASERRQALAAGWDVAHDGMEITLEHAFAPAGI
ncbi:MAG TPA: pyrroloquinoline quinone biosynthesis protein PqqB [Rhizomicrobium sp.]|nr:pyrroloquinoline quinone biosynthesis protein PqqB [Rhizomicrobium sp.]